MATILLKNLADKINILEQQNSLLSYAKKHRISISHVEVDTSKHDAILEERLEFKGFLRSLDSGSTLLIYDFWVLSSEVDELVKVVECLLQRDITLHICSQKTLISPSSSPLHVVTLLSNERTRYKDTAKNISQGRPKGRMSRSKFDIYRSQIISYLEQNYSVSKIADILQVRRTSLKDYINSRNLKVLVTTKKELLGAKPKKIALNEKKPKKCDLIEKEE